MLIMAWLVGSPGALAHSEGTCRSDRCHQLRERMWDWYHSSGAKCVRELEGAWHDLYAPYWGGFQADLSFQTTYGRGTRGASYFRRWGYASHWPRFRQIHMAYRGQAERGWGPWPNTARVCGLL